MSEIKRLFKNTGWATISQIVCGLFAFLWTILIARYLGVNEFGILSFGISFNYLASVLLDPGLTVLSTRDMSRNNNLIGEYMGKLLPLKVILFILTFLLTLIILVVMGYNILSIEVTLILTFQVFFLSTGSLLSGSFQAISEFKYTSIGFIIYSCIQFLFILIGILFDLGLIFISISYVLGYVVMCIYLYYETNVKIAKLKLKIDTKFYIKFIKLSLPFALTSLFTTIYYSIDMIMLSYIVGDFATGLYNSSYKIINILTTLFSIYQTVMFPLMSRLFTDSENLLKLSFNKSIKYLLLMTMPLTLGIVLYAKPIVTLIYGNAYNDSFTIVRILIWTVILLFINGAATTLLNSSNNEKAVTKIYGIGAIFNIILNIILISIYSYNGAALATLVSEIFICFLMFYVINKTGYSPDKSIFIDIIKIIIANTVMFCSLIFVPNLWLGIFIGIIIYVLILRILKTFDEDDKNLIKEIIN